MTHYVPGNKNSTDFPEEEGGNQPQEDAGTKTNANPTPRAKTTGAGKVAPSYRKPIEAVLHECRRTLYVAIFLSIIIDILSLAPMMYSMNVTDKAMNARSEVTLWSLTFIVILTYVFWAAMDWIRNRILVRLSLRIDWDLSTDVFDAAFRRHVTSKNIDVHELLGDLTRVRDFVTGQGLLVLIDAPFTIIFFVIAYAFNPFLGLFTLFSIGSSALTTYLTHKVTSPALKVANDAHTNAAKVAANHLRHAETALALGMMGPVRNRWYAHHHKHLQHQVNASEASSFMTGFAGLLAKSLPSLQMCIATFLAINNIISLGMVFAAGMIISKAVSPMGKVLGSWKMMVQTYQSYERINALLTSDKRLEQKMQLPSVIGSLVVDKVSATPPGTDKIVLNEINFTAKPGQVIAIVGPSAAGKSSLARLLIGVWAPSQGSVRLDGVEISDWNHDEFGPQLGYVPQDIEFVDGSVAENICRFEEIDPEKIVQATKLVGMHETILAFPKGYDTLLGASGFPLSGGQRQRLAICRALYKTPKYIVMDEPNASLDDIGESSLAQAITFLKSQGSTVIITTHRPRLISVADQLLVLRNGVQVGFGPADEMINAVRNLQLVAQNKAKESADNGEAQDVKLKDGTNDADSQEGEIS